MVAGHLREINGFYYMVISYKEKNGKRKNHTKATGLPIKGNKKKAEHMLLQAKMEMEMILEEQEQQEEERKSKITFAQFMQEWLQMKQNTVDESTYASYRFAVEVGIVPYFEEKHPGLLLSELTAKHIQDYYTYELRERNVSANTVRHRHANIGNALKYAVRMDLLMSNPAEKVVLPRIQKYVASYYNERELTVLFERVRGTPLELGVFLASYYGLRRSEIIGLKWSAVDFERKTITIKHTVMTVNDDGKERLVQKDRTKNKSSYRTLPLVAPFEELLLRLKETQELNRRLCGNCYCNRYLEYIYVNEIGELIRPDYLSRLSQFLRDNELRPIRFHDLRHSCASLLLANGVNLKDIQSWLGHSTITTTANIYVHQEFTSKITSANAILQILPDMKQE